MVISLDLNWIASVLLASLRVAVVLLLTPLTTFASVPLRFRVLFVLGLSALLVSALELPSPGRIPSLTTLAAAAVGELLLGGVLSFGLVAGFAAFQLAGRVIDVQLGFGVAALIDPTTKVQTPLLGTFLYMTAVVAFFAIDGHHLVIRALSYSLERIPPGARFSGMELDAVTMQFGTMFSLAIAIAAPVVFVLLLVDAALAVMARSMPQMNVFFISLPLKIAIGLVTLALALGYLGPVSTKVFESMFGYIERVIG